MIAAPTVGDVIQGLSQPRAYPESPSAVEVVQTHLSALFFVGAHVYKVKKPVNFGFVDYSTLEKRLHFCEREVELNRRLCPDLYLGVVVITAGPEGLSVDAPGTPIEYAVKMQRMPKDRMLDVMLDQGRVSPQMIDRVARRLAEFHASAESSPTISAYGAPDVIRENVDENFAQTQAYVGRSITWRQFERISAYTYDALARHGDLLRQRISEGRIRDCHGDVHSQHVCFANGLYIYDCIEFNERFRYSDVAAEIAFLGMDLDYHGQHALAARFVDTYVDATGDTDLLRLLRYYQCYRAYVRGKVESFRLDDTDVPPAERSEALRRAQRYFRLAYAYSATPDRPALYLVLGLPGTGKSTLAEALSEPLAAKVLNSDVVRKELAGVASSEHRYAGFGQGIYTPEFDRRTYESLVQSARAELQAGHSVILDATFRHRADRLHALEIARQLDIDAWVIECVLDDDLTRERMRQREAEPSASDALAENLPNFKASVEPLDEVAAHQHLRVDTRATPSELVQQVLNELPYFFQ